MSTIQSTTSLQYEDPDMTETKSKNLIQDVICCFKRLKKEKIEDENSDGEVN